MTNYQGLLKLLLSQKFWIKFLLYPSAQWWPSTERMITNKFQCSFCEKEFKLKGILKNHMNTHTNVKTYSCNHCDRSFLVSSNLTHHIWGLTLGRHLLHVTNAKKGFPRPVTLKSTKEFTQEKGHTHEKKMYKSLQKLRWPYQAHKNAYWREALFMCSL